MPEPSGLAGQFAAWLGLVPRQNSSGGKERLGGISKMGDRYLRHLLVVGATAIVRYTKRKATAVSLWANRLLECKPARLVTVAVANTMARIAWAVMAREEAYRAAPSPPETSRHHSHQQFGQERTTGVILIRSSRRSGQPA